MKFSTYEEMAKDVAEKALDEYVYQGKTLREWIQIVLESQDEDCISRREALKMFMYNYEGERIPDYDCDNFPVQIAMKTVKEMLRKLPSVTPKPKEGHWEWVQYDGNPNIGNWHCSECQTIIPHMPEETDNTPIYKWCPMCGAKMVETQESEG